MFKSRIPLQTPIAIKLFLIAVLAIFFAGWSFSAETSSSLGNGELLSVEQ
ncbi:MAG: hypothetical protein AAGE96_17285 [Cyanobacteria bacterium P01_G01_bin.19]